MRSIPLDGIRGIAILGVLLNHYVHALPQIGARSALSYFERLCHFGWLGVDLFFVLSGFLIGGILIRNRRCSAKVYFCTFYFRRFFRIVPAYALAISLAILIGPGLHLEGAFYAVQPEPSNLIWYATFTQNFAPLFVPTTNWFGQSWSLALEEQFYLLIPFLLFVLPDRFLPNALIILIVAAPVFRIVAVVTCVPEKLGIIVYSMLPARMDALLLGVLCAWLCERPPLLAWVRLPALAGFIITSGALCVFVAKDWNYLSVPMMTAGYSLAAIWSASLILLCYRNSENIFAAALSFPPLTKLGQRAYFLYLWHGVFPYAGFALFARAPQIFTITDVMIFALGISGMMLAAEVSWKLFERPLIDIGHRMNYDAESSQSR